MRIGRASRVTRVPANAPAVTSNSGTRGRRSRARLLGAEDEAGVPHPDHVAIVELPGLHRVAVDGGAVGGAEVRQRGRLTVPADLQVPARHTGVGQPERGVLPAADHVGALGEVVGAPGAVVEREGGGALLVAVALLPVTRLPVARLAVPRLAVALLVARVVALVVLLPVARLAVPRLAVALVVARLAVAG